MAPTTEELLQAWREASRAAELADRLAGEALAAAERAEWSATVAEEIAKLAEGVAVAAAGTAKRAREAATAARATATDASTRGLPGAHSVSTDASADEASARDLFHESEDEARRRHVAENREK